MYRYGSVCIATDQQEDKAAKRRRRRPGARSQVFKWDIREEQKGRDWVHVVINVDQLKESSTKPKGRRRNSRIQLFFNYSKSWPCTFSELDDKEVQRKRDSEKSLGRYSFYIVRPRGRRMPCLSGSIFFSSGLRRRSIFWCVDLEWNLIYHYLRREKDGEKERERKGDIKKREGRDSCYWIKPPSAWWTFQLFVDLFFFLSTPSCGRNQDLKKKKK